MQLGFLKCFKVFDKLSNFPRIPLTLFPNNENCKLLLLPFPVPLLVFCFNIWTGFPPFAMSGMGRVEPNDRVGLAMGSSVVESRSVKKEPVLGKMAGQGVSSAACE